MEKHFLIEFDFFNPSIDEESAYLKLQEGIIAEFKKSHRIMSISVSDNNAVMWVVMKAESESELVFLMDSLDFPEFSGYDYYELNTHISINSYETFSLN